MQKRHALRDDQREKIKDTLPGKPEDPGRTAGDKRLFIEAVVWAARLGTPWRNLPPEHGKLRRRYPRWTPRWPSPQGRTAGRSASLIPTCTDSACSAK
jgi:transposase